MKPRCELDERGKRIVVTFDYNPQHISEVKSSSGRKYVAPDKGGPYWTVPLDLHNARELRRIFGSELVLGERVRAWGKEQVQKERNLMSVAGAADAELQRLPEENEDLFKFISTRPYQRADVAQMAQTSAINANEPSLGKTVEVIASIWEAGLEDGAHLIISPTSTLDSVWEPEIEKHDGAEVFIFQGPGREWTWDKAMEHIEGGDPAYVLTNPATVLREAERLQSVEWSTVAIDEFHKSGLPNSKSKFFEAVKKIPRKRFWALSGTPIGGKPRKLWTALYMIDPVTYSSEWNWIRRWLEVDPGHFGTSVGGIRRGLEQQFYEAHRSILIRRTKAEVRPELPEKMPVEVICKMTPTQAKQYYQMAEETEIRIEEEHLSASNILALYTRLKQFANARCDIKAGKVIPTYDSGKLLQLLERLEERGITKEPEGNTQVIIGTQFAAFAQTVYKFLTEEHGIPDVAILHGGTKRADRGKMAGPNGLFQKGKIRVLILVTTAGGVGLNLDNAESCHVLDETWNPDDQTQLTDRGHRFTGLTVYTYRAPGTIEQYIEEVGIDKTRINELILDARIKMKAAVA